VDRIAKKQLNVKCETWTYIHLIYILFISLIGGL
jgi:hypothetical protein